MMEVTDFTNIVHNRIQKLDPENATKIIGYLLLQYTHQEIMAYACGPNELIQSLISEAKSCLLPSPMHNALGPTDYPLRCMASQTISRPVSSPSAFRVPAPSFWEPQIDSLPTSYDIGGLCNQAELLSLDDRLHPMNRLDTDISNNFYYPEDGMQRSLRSSTTSPDSPAKLCYYFYKGFCKHGSNCRYFHGLPDRFPYIYSPYPNELLSEDPVFAPGSLEKLEIEITELLQARKGMPVSIAALPMIYLEKYGRALQADGYLTESQRHGKAGFNLTKLLARLKSVRLIDRPHGQHSVVLAEEAPKYMEYSNERSDPGAALASSHQIYLTFPAESTFSDYDVLNYFNLYGPVRDVRIPRQEKRMFGFVSFLYPETVKTILAKGHPHYICGSRVLVKPYREKSRTFDKKYLERIELPACYPSHYVEMNEDPTEIPNLFDNTRLLRKQLIEEQEHAMELQRRRLLELQLTTKQLTANPFSYRMEDLRSQDDHFSFFPAVQNNCSRSDDKANSGRDSDYIELPDSPFASPRIASPPSDATNLHRVA